MEDLGSNNHLIVMPAIVFDFRLIISVFWSVRYREMAHERRANVSRAIDYNVMTVPESSGPGRDLRSWVAPRLLSYVMVLVGTGPGCIDFTDMSATLMA